MMPLSRKLKNLDHYRRAALTTLPISFALLLYLILAHGDSFLLSEWFLDLLIIPGFIGSLISSSTYLARMLDGCKKNPAVGKKEKIGTMLGIGIGLCIGIAAVVLHETIPLASCLADAAKATFTLSQISSYAGLGNRIGGSLDNTRLRNEKWSMGISALLGVGIGLTLFLTGAVACVSMVGLTTVFSGGVALPFWLSGILFVSSFSSSFASFGDYAAKSVNFIKSKCTRGESTTKKRVQDRLHEYRGSFVGSNLGLAVGVAIVVGLTVTQPHVVAGLVGLISAAVIVTTCISVVGGLCSRIGRLFDGFTKKKPAALPSASPLQKPAMNSASISRCLKPSTAKSEQVSPGLTIPSPELRPKPRENKTITPSQVGLFKPSRVQTQDAPIIGNTRVIWDYFKIG